MDTFLFVTVITVAGISYAMILFLIASGFSLIFGNMGVLNLAHGALYMLGAYFGLTVTAVLGGNWWLGLLVAGVGVALVGIVVDRLLLRRLYKQINDQVLLTVGLAYIFGNICLWIWGGWPKMGTAPAIMSGSIPIDHFSISVYRLMLIVFGLGIFAGLWWLQDRTRVGSIIRAGMDDKTMVTALGVNYLLISGVIFGVGAFMGGLAGFLGAPIIGTYPAIAMDITLLAVIVVIVGGIGRVQGSFLGAVLIGLIDSFCRVFLPDFSMFTPYLLMTIILIVKPSGLLGRTH